MFQEFTKSVHQARADVKTFTDRMRSDETRAIFAQAEQSAEQDPLGIKPWRHREDPDWFGNGSKA